MQLNKPISVIFTLLITVITVFAGYGILNNMLVTGSNTDLAIISNISIWAFIIFISAGTILLTLFSKNINVWTSAFGVPLSFGLFLLSFQLGKLLIIIMTAIINMFKETMLGVIIIMLMYLFAFIVILGLPIGVYFYLITR